MIAYEFNTPVGSTEEILLLSLRSTWDSKIDLMYHVEQSLLGNVPPLQFRDKISEEHKECVPEHIKDIKIINERLFNSFDEKIKNINKSAIDIARETDSHIHHCANDSHST